LFNLTQEREIAVVELGMRALGEIYTLGEIVQPDYAIISNVAPVHMETLGSIENIARAKCEVLSFIKDEKFALLNGDDPVLLEAAAAYPCPKYCFGYGPGCDIRIVTVSHENEGITVELELFDRHDYFFVPVGATQLASNIASVVGMAYLLGVQIHEIKAALNNYLPSGNRLHITHLPTGGTVIDDSYNANPLSMITALDLCKRQAGGLKTMAILGDMFELGEYSEEGHILVGNRVAELNFDTLVAIGENAQYIVEGALKKGMSSQAIHYFHNREDCLPWLLDEGQDKNCCAVFKASRGMQLEILAKAWMEK
jgi:UDP-N-acetylmuramoyl-tripeptide--D-alanyl-D-alanine ligase